MRPSGVSSGWRRPPSTRRAAWVSCRSSPWGPGTSARVRATGSSCSNPATLRCCAASRRRAAGAASRLCCNLRSSRWGRRAACVRSWRVGRSPTAMSTSSWKAVPPARYWRFPRSRSNKAGPRCSMAVWMSSPRRRWRASRTPLFRLPRLPRWSTSSAHLAGSSGPCVAVVNCWPRSARRRHWSTATSMRRHLRALLRRPPTKRTWAPC
mmetsp:Transcript_12881/g.38783  ORF Transcript_12881/g.38783 Transcript_12881/m.38783 type:complete len:209 (+) Transcript_12881:302-928(+)